MSAKQAKRARKAARERGEVAHVDAKRAASNAQFADIERKRAETERRREEVERFCREYPEVYEAQQRARVAKVPGILRTLGAFAGLGVR